MAKTTKKTTKRKAAKRPAKRADTDRFLKALAEAIVKRTFAEAFKATFAKRKR